MRSMYVAVALLFGVVSVAAAQQSRPAPERKAAPSIGVSRAFEQE